jgi:hypothetical protein
VDVVAVADDRTLGGTALPLQRRAQQLRLQQMAVCFRAGNLKKKFLLKNGKTCLSSSDWLILVKEGLAGFGRYF